jgi:hypothetical protein
MPITFTIDEEAGRVTLRFLGTVTDRDLFTTFEELYGDPRHRIGMPELTDCRDVERVEITAEGLRGLATATQASLDPAREPWKVAVVAPADLVFGLGRMYELLREGSPEQVQVFRDITAAERWLSVP